MKTRYAVSILLLLLVVISGILAIDALNNSRPMGNANTNTAIYTYEVIQVYSHDTKAFTQGLIYADGFLIESTGLYGQSSLRRIDLSTGDIIQQVDLPYQYFGEGITAVDDKIIQVTWTTKIGFIYNVTNFEVM
jgi:glutamine cyclotransferase